MAIRAAIAAKVNITYKILYNDAVAMTGGQHVDGYLDVPMLTRQLAAEGVKRIVITTTSQKNTKGCKAWRLGLEVFIGVSLSSYNNSCVRLPAPPF